LERLKDQLAAGEMRRSIWMVHHPPADLGMDICDHGQRVGSPAVHQFAVDNQPLIGCSGHIHESPYMHGGCWFAQVDKTIWLQPGQIDFELHYVTLEIAGDFSINSIRHSIFGDSSS
jgi:Icc-related predicted phosphoesterase